MPGRSSSPIPAGLGQLVAARPPAPGEHPGLLNCLAAVPDPRRAKGRRHPLAFVLALAACAVLTGARSLTAIAEWAADAPPTVLAALGGPCREPSGPTAPTEATVRRVLQRIDGDAFDIAIGSWLAARDPDRLPSGQDPLSRPRCSLAVDGKTNEITVFRPMLAELDLADIVVTFDALHSRTAHARFLVKEKKAHCNAVIKGNQRLLYQRLKRLPWRDVPLLGKTRATAHGRDEIRRVKTATVADLDFPRAAQAVKIVRRRRTIAVGAVTLERVFAVTGLAADQADAADIALRIRRHWVIENQLHHVRDTAWTEDASRVCTGTAPRVMASLRNRHRCPPPGRAPEYRRRPPPPRAQRQPPPDHPWHHVIKPHNAPN